VTDHLDHQVPFNPQDMMVMFRQQQPSTKGVLSDDPNAYGMDDVMEITKIVDS